MSFNKRTCEVFYNKERHEKNVCTIYENNKHVDQDQATPISGLLLLLRLILFDLMLYVPVNIFLLCRDTFLIEPLSTKQRITCLAQGHNSCL